MNGGTLGSRSPGLARTAASSGIPWCNFAGRKIDLYSGIVGIEEKELPHSCSRTAFRHTRKSYRNPRAVNLAI
jgi:hypothetical protein